MARTKTYVEEDIVDGYMEVRLSSWKYFHDYIRKEMLEYSHFFWRGQRDSEWGLQTSFDRLVEGLPLTEKKSLLKRQLEAFKLSSRGRRGNNPSREIHENEWWALGQHNSLATPLLDWTHAPFVALYFAFEKPVKPKSGFRSVWAIYPTTTNNKIRDLTVSSATPQLLEIIRPHQDENSRLVSQNGLFTRAPLGQTVDIWLKQNSKGLNTASLLKIIIPDKDRENCLRSLNRMNINHLTLFPDLYGSAQHCNKSLLIEKY